jgi:hypothetical protein
MGLLTDDDWAQALDYELRLRGSDESSGAPSGDGPFYWDRLEPGTYDLQVQIGGERDSHVLAEVRGLTVGDGRTLVDPRLNPIDLRGKVRMLAVRVVDAEDKLIDRSATSVRAAVEGTDVWWRGESHARGHRVLVPTGKPVRGLISAKGYRPVDIPHLNRDRTVILEPALRVTLSFTGVPERLRDNSLVLVRPIYAEGTPSRERLQLRVAAISGDAVSDSFPLVLPRPGLFDLEVQEDQTGRRSSTQLEITEGQDGQTITLPYPGKPPPTPLR